MIFPQLKTEEEAILALSFLKGIGPVLGKTLLQHFGCAKAVFESSDHELLNIDGIGKSHLTHIRESPDITKIQKELTFCNAKNISILPYFHEKYPLRLKQLVDSPLFLFTTGKADLNPPKSIGIVGTRKPTKNGILHTQQIIKELSGVNVQIIS